MTEFWLHIYITFVGFVTAGIIASFSRMVTGRPLSFAMRPPVPMLWAIPAVMIRIFAAPFILVRNSVRGALIERRPVPWLIMSFLIATFWSFVSGIVVIETLLSISS